ncbi:MAG TPA: hypothetical protein VHC97_05435 [Thermoanaerobaculia bacterium]|nr:hypothetical protein [Thermoanaerobaculia bacterium]
MSKRPFDVDEAFARIEEAVRPFPKAAMFELTEEGFDSPFELPVACIISIRTLDEVTLVCSRRLFGLARTPDALGRLALGAIDEAIGVSTFHEAKARQIREIARRIVAEHGGKLPCRNDIPALVRGRGTQVRQPRALNGGLTPEFTSKMIMA